MILCISGQSEGQKTSVKTLSSRADFVAVGQPLHATVLSSAVFRNRGVLPKWDEKRMRETCEV